MFEFLLFIYGSCGLGAFWYSYQAMIAENDTMLMRWLLTFYSTVAGIFWPALIVFYLLAWLRLGLVNRV